MGLQTCIASTDFDLTTTSKVKDVIGTTATSDDGYISDLIRRASRWAEHYVGYPLTAQFYRETVASFGSRHLTVSRTPIRSVIAMWDSTSTADASTFLSSEYRLDADAGFVDRDAGWAWRAPLVPSPFAVPLSESPWAGQESPTWLTDYVAGYTYNGIDTGSPLWSTAKGSTSTGRTLPEDIEAAVITKAAAWYNGDDNVAEKSVGDLRLRYSTFGAESNRIDPASALLDQYRRLA